MPNKSLKLSLTLFGLLMILSSCDCFSSFEGQVIDAETNIPISDVTISLETDGKNRDTTDLTGHFRLTEISMNCPDITLLVFKAGYESQKIITGDTLGLLIKLKKTQ